MLIELGENIKIQEKYSMQELSAYPDENDSSELAQARMLGFNPTRIFIKDRWFDAIPLHTLYRTRTEDGYYRFIYIQINYRTGEYYIGKVNRKNWKELIRYQGSGLLFRNKYDAHEDEFVRYYIAACETQKETEALEASIVDDELLKDKNCLNLVRGGGGTNEHYDKEKRSKRQKEIMKEHPEFFQSMVEAAKKLYQSGSSPQLERRSRKIKETMNQDEYKEMMSVRIRTWKQDHPEEYEASRENNRKAQADPAVKEKKRKSREKWIQEHPDEYEAVKNKALAAAHSPEAEKKRSKSLKAFYRDDPRGEELTRKRSAASVEVCRKSVNMLDLETGEVLMTFPSQHEGARWLVEQGLAKNTNCVSSISAVCLKKPCTTGYGYRKKAYGFGWEFADKETAE